MYRLTRYATWDCRGCRWQAWHPYVASTRYVPTSTDHFLLPTVYDSGIRNGADIVRALALGAQACLIGRPWVYGLAFGGRDGVEHVLKCTRIRIPDILWLNWCFFPSPLDTRSPGRAGLDITAFGYPVGAKGAFEQGVFKENECLTDFVCKIQNGRCVCFM